MNPQGSGNFNPEFFQQLTAEINAIDECSELQAVVDQAFGSINAWAAAVEGELALVLPIKALLTAPGANLGAIVTWIQNFITNVLTPLVRPTLTLAAQAAQILTEVAALTSAIENAAARITHCEIAVPTITVSASVTVE